MRANGFGRVAAVWRARRASGVRDDGCAESWRRGALVLIQMCVDFDAILEEHVGGRHTYFIAPVICVSALMYGCVIRLWSSPAGVLIAARSFTPGVGPWQEDYRNKSNFVWRGPKH